MIRSKTIALALASLGAMAIIVGYWWFHRGQPQDLPVQGASSHPALEPGREIQQDLETESVPSTATVSGLVSDTTGRGLEGALVCVFPAEPYSEISRPATCTRSDEGSSFELVVAAHLPFSVTAAASGHFAATSPRKGVLRLEPGAHVSVDVQLAAGGAPVRGVVLDGLGGTVQGALVAVEASGFALTDEEGKFEVWAHRNDTVKIHVAHSSYASLNSLVSVPTQGVELVLMPAAEVSGVVYDQHGDPLAGIEVYPSPISSHSSSGRVGGAAATTDARGRFLLRGLAPGAIQPTAISRGLVGHAEPTVAVVGETTEVEIHVTTRPHLLVDLRTPDGESACKEPWVKVRRGVGPWSMAFRDVDERGFVSVPIAPGESASLEAGCDGFVSVQVDVASSREDPIVVVELGEAHLVSGTVVDATSAPVPRASVYISDPSRQRTDLTVVSENDGSFEAWAWRGPIEVWVRTGNVRSDPLDLVSPVDSVTLEVPLRDPKRGTIAGTVGDGTSTIQGLKVVAYASTGMAATSAAIGGGGDYEISSLVPGRYDVGLSRSGLASRAEGEMPEGTRRVDVRAGEVATVDFSGGIASPNAVSGTVWDEDRVPLPDAQISAYVEGVYTQWRTLTDGEGAFRLDGLPGPIARLKVVAADGRETTLRSPPASVDVQLERTYQVCGRVVPPSGGLSVSLDGHDFQFSDPAGNWCIPGVRSGEHLVQVRAGGRTGARKISVSSSLDDVVVTLNSASGPVSGVCGAPGAARVYAYGNGGKLDAAVDIAADGSFGFKELSAGEITLLVVERGSTPARPLFESTLKTEPGAAIHDLRPCQ